jgi:hypothetical protein
MKIFKMFVGVQTKLRGVQDTHPNMVPAPPETEQCKVSFVCKGRISWPPGDSPTRSPSPFVSVTFLKMLF